MAEPGAVKADRCSCGRCRPELVSDDCSAVPVLFWMYTPDGEAEFAADPILCRRACPWCGSALLIIDDQPWVIPAGTWEAMARKLRKGVPGPWTPEMEGYLMRFYSALGSAISDELSKMAGRVITPSAVNSRAWLLGVKYNPNSESGEPAGIPAYDYVAPPEPEKRESVLRQVKELQERAQELPSVDGAVRIPPEMMMEHARLFMAAHNAVGERPDLMEISGAVQTLAGYGMASYLGTTNGEVVSEAVRIVVWLAFGLLMDEGLLAETQQ